MTLRFTVNDAIHSKNCEILSNRNQVVGSLGIETLRSHQNNVKMDGRVGETDKPGDLIRPKWVVFIEDSHLLKSTTPIRTDFD